MPLLYAGRGDSADSSRGDFEIRRDLKDCPGLFRRGNLEGKTDRRRTFNPKRDWSISSPRLSQIEGIEDLSLTTNGILLKEFAEDLKKAGLKRINISLDSLKRERFYQITRRDDFERVWAGIEEAMRVGLSPIKINMVAIQGINDDEIESFAQLTLRFPLTIRYIEYMPSGNGEEWKKNDILTIPQIKNRLENMGKLISIPSDRWDGPAKRFRIEGAIGEIGLIGAGQ